MQSFIVEIAKCFVTMEHTLPESSKSGPWLFPTVVCKFCGAFSSELLYELVVAELLSDEL